MRVRLTLDVDERERFVIAKYFDSGSRATRAEVRVFATGALRSAVGERAACLSARQRTTERRLATGKPVRQGLVPMAETQMALPM